ncbi:hypothetical protein P3X46_013697 [Hevea brasiliensis]|nr:hypothetical protein P3X46_013697 [Hevea brasiliensis]
MQVIFSSASTTATVLAFLFDLVTPRPPRREPKKEEKKEEPKIAKPPMMAEKEEEKKKDEVEPLRPLKEDWKIYTASRRSAGSTLGIRRSRMNG